jgi:glycosyltransferase involved in cell wall biosynthesis
VQHQVRVLTPYLAERLLQEHASSEYDPLINFEVERYQDRYTFMALRGHQVTLGALPPFSLSTIAAVQRAMAHFRPDVLNAHYVMPTGLGALWGSLRNRLPMIITFNGRDVPGPGVPWLWKYWHRLAARLATDVTYVSHYCRRAIFGDGVEAPGHVIYNGVFNNDSRSFRTDGQRVREEWGIPPGDKILFSLQRLTSDKRADIVIQSFKHVLQACPETVLLIGGQGPMRAALEALVVELGLQARVRFLGYIPRHHMPEYFCACDVFMFHSTYETFGMVVAEAMSYGKPVVSVRNTAIPEVVLHDESGLLVPPDNPAAMAAAAVQLLRDANLRRRMGEAGLARARTQFSWDRIAQQYEAVFASAVRAG